VTLGVLNVTDIKRTGMLFDVLDDSDSSDVVSVLDEANISGFEMSIAFNLVGRDIVLECIADLDLRVGESDSSGVVGNDVGNLVRTNGFSSNFQKLDL
jgi:hypothetical protein